MGSNGTASQPFAEEARDFLRELVLGKTIHVRLHSIDQYSRLVASVYVKRFLFLRKNVSLALVDAGLATVYRAKGAEYGNIREDLEAAESAARYIAC